MRASWFLGVSDMRYMTPKFNPAFVGRVYEKQYLLDVAKSDEASIIITYGRRRVGKTELLEQVFKDRHMLKFEGIEGKDQVFQRQHVMSQLAEYAEQPLLAKIVCNTWVEVFKYIFEYTEAGVQTLYFEEVQWLAAYKDDFAAELKYVWDNFFRYNNQLVLILCGSSPSFMIENILHSKALYNRSQYELPLSEFTLIEAREFLSNRSEREVLDAYLTVGGIPEYLKYLNKGSSVLTSLCKHSFTRGAYFANEYERIFTSSLADNQYYKSIVDFLSQRRFATRQDMLEAFQVGSGGKLTALLNDLSLCGFIKKYVPYNLNEKSTLARYCIDDNYLQFYYKFIAPMQSSIASGDHNKSPNLALNTHAYHQWLGYAFERMCRKYHRVLASKLGFSGVKYQVGSFYNKKSLVSDKQFQLDLVFDRKDQVYTLCEIKYTQAKAGTQVIEEFERKLAQFPNKDNKTIQKVLIAKEGADNALIARGYFDVILDSRDLFDPRDW